MSKKKSKTKSKSLRTRKAKSRNAGPKKMKKIMWKHQGR